MLQRRWLRIVITVLVAVAALLILKSLSQEAKAQGEVINMHNIKGGSADTLKGYQKVTGVLDIEHWVTNRGVQVYYVPVKTLPIVDIDLVVDAGAARDGKKSGLANLTANLLLEGTTHLSADQVAENFENLGAEYQIHAQRDAALISLRSLSDKAQLIPVVENLAAILREPTFPEAGFRREQQNTISALKQQAQKPNQVAMRAFFNLVYPDQPYANWVLGNEDSVLALKPADLKAFHKQFYVPENMVIAIVGDLSLQDADQIAQMLTNYLPQGQKASTFPPVKDLSAQTIKKISFPSSQTHILMGMPGMAQNDPDYYPLYVGNHILGGNGMVTRIFNTIRNEYGLAYSAYSQFYPMREKGPFMLGCQTRKDQAAKAQSLMKDLLVEFVEEGPTETELEDAKQNLLGGYALQFDSNAAICREVASLGYYRLPLEHFNQFKTKVDQVTIQDIKAAFQKRIFPDKLAIVTVGDGTD